MIKTTYRKGFVLFAGGLENLDMAKSYINKNGFTSEDVKIVSNNDELLVITKKDVVL